MFRRFMTEESGQGMTEYILIIALIAVVTVGAVKLFGRQVLDLFSQSTDKIKTETAGFNR